MDQLRDFVRVVATPKEWEYRKKTGPWRCIDLPIPEPMQSLYKRLTEVGLPRAFVRQFALPSWWDDSVVTNPAAYSQGLMLLSRHLGLDLQSLLDASQPVRLREFGPCKFKKRDDATEDSLALARAMATRAAQLAASTISEPFADATLSALEIRQQILDQGSRWVGLDELVVFCWSAGIPVLHLDHFPAGARRPDGFAARVAGRPVIVICRAEQQPAWLLFILAHELGHIMLGHVPEDGTLVDERVRESDAPNTDAEERDANQFAIELLTGSAQTRYAAAGRWPNAGELANSAKSMGRSKFVEPGHIVLNYASSMGANFFPVARAALKIIEPHAHAIKLIRDRMSENMDWSQLPEDSCEFLMRVTRGGTDS